MVQRLAVTVKPIAVIRIDSSLKNTLSLLPSHVEIPFKGPRYMMLLSRMDGSRTEKKSPYLLGGLSKISSRLNKGC